MRNRLSALIAFLLLPLALAAQGVWTTPRSTNGKVRIASTAVDALGVGCVGSAPAASACTGGIYAGGATFSGAIKASVSSGFAGSGTFRNLYLRTHLDFDVAFSKVELVSADEVVMEDGTRYTAGLGQLVADITVAGAGGLDTGAEAASTWYEIYLITKDDGTKTLLLHRAKDYLRDTSFVTAVDTLRGLRRATSTATDKLAQSFQLPTTAGKIEFVDIPLGIATAPTGNVWFTLEADNAGSPSGTALARSDKYNGNVLPSGPANERFLFRTPVSLTATTTYWLVLQGDYTRSDTINDVWRGVAAGGYASGSAKEFNGTTWAAASGVLDFDFQMYVTRNEAAVTMPAGYTRKALIGYVYNTAGSNFFPFTQLDRSVQYARTVASSAVTQTVTQPLLLDLSVFLPPGPRRVKGQVSNATATNAVLLWGLPEYAQGSAVQAIHSGITGAISSYWPILTEAQALYATVDAGTGTVYVSGFDW